MSSILITGADGYVGSRLVERFLKETDHELVLWVRSSSTEDFAKKKEKLAGLVGSSLPRVKMVGGDLSQENPFEGVQTKSIKRILHTAAIIRFNVDEESANRVNRQGATKVFDFAKSCSHLEQLGYVSTVYASGLKDQAIAESRFDSKAGFSNHYERSKWEAEEILFEKYDDLPWQVYRMATAICDNDSGRVTQYNAVHNTLKLFYYGLISLLPGEKRTPLYFITGDFAADAMFRLSQKNKLKTIYHIAHAMAESTTLQEMIDRVFSIFEKDDDFKHRRILRPLFVKYEAFQRMSEAMGNFGSEFTSSALATVTPFAQQLFIAKDVEVKNTRRDLESHYQAPVMNELLVLMAADLLLTKWGRYPEKRQEKTTASQGGQ